MYAVIGVKYDASHYNFTKNRSFLRTMTIVFKTSIVI